MKQLVILICCTWYTYHATAQAGLYNTGGLYISSIADTVYITGALNNEATATLHNVAGNIYAKGNMTNNEPNMLAVGGKLWCIGTAIQDVSGTEQLRTHHWIVNNNSGITLHNRVSVGNGTAVGTLTFASGTITSGTAMQDVYFNTNSNYNNYSNTNHIIGYCSKAGSSNFTFPIGTGTIQADADITNLSSAATFQCKYVDSGYGNYTMVPPLISVYDKEYWIIDNTQAAATCNVTLKWNDARKVLNHTYPTNLHVGHFTSGAWYDEFGTGSGNTPMGTVTSVPVSSFSPFTFASGATILSSKLTHIQATAKQCGIQLMWQHQALAVKYKLYKSLDGVQWSICNEVTANNDNNITTQDNDVLSGIQYQYKLKVYNSNNTYYYTHIAMQKANCSTYTPIQVFPTITTDIVHIKLAENLTQPALLTIIQADGRLVQSMQLRNTTTPLSLKKYNDGNYILTIKQGGYTHSFKVIKQ